MDKYTETVKPAYPQIRQWFCDGLSEGEILQKLGISRSSLRRYRKDHGEFDRFWRESRAARDDLVEEALFRRATGYCPGDDPEKQVPPDVRAAVFWLKNRRPKRWQDRREKDEAPAVQVKLIVEEKDL